MAPFHLLKSLFINRIRYFGLVHQCFYAVSISCLSPNMPSEASDVRGGELFVWQRFSYKPQIKSYPGGNTHSLHKATCAGNEDEPRLMDIKVSPIAPIQHYVIVHSSDFN